jgi:hypothetical protein
MAVARRRFSGSAPVVTVAPTLKTMLDQLRAGKAPKTGDLVRLLVTLKAYQETFGQIPPPYQSARVVPVPIDLLDVIGERLIGRAQYVVEARKARSDATRMEWDQLQRAAEDLWKRKPELAGNFSEAARIVAPGRWNTVRRFLKKPTREK